MLHTSDDFLNAIEAHPADRTRRLIFADWLDERADPRGELIRVEEEMRELPVFADRFWELKPRRNELREKAGTTWCERMRYGTECEPVFRHGIPEGWRERWRLIREFTERWHRIPMGDVGDRQNEIARMESRYGRTLPPAVREWIAFGLEWQWDQDYPGKFRQMYLQEVPGNAAFSLWYKESMYDRFGDYHFGVRFSDLREPDPPLCDFRYAVGEDHNYGFVLDEHRTPIGTVTAFALNLVIDSACSDDGFIIDREHLPDLRRDLNQTFPHYIKSGNSEWYETETVSLRIGPSLRRGGEAYVILRVSELNPLVHVPGFLWRYVRLGRKLSGLFKCVKLK